jgi:hypothetical protein
VEKPGLFSQPLIEKLELNRNLKKGYKMVKKGGKYLCVNDSSSENNEEGYS